MKKVLKLVTALALTLIFAVSFTACGGDNDGVNYGGKYTIITDQVEIEQLFTDIEANIESMQAWTGYKANVTTKMAYEGQTSGGSGTIYLTMDGDKIEMSSQASGTEDGVKMTYKTYYKDGWMYEYLKAGSDVQKVKFEVEDILEYQDNASMDQIFQALESVFDYDFEDLEQEGVTISATATSGARNIKILIEQAGVGEDLEIDLGEGTSVEIIIALNSQGNVIGIRMYTKASMFGMSTEMTLEFEPFSGKISFPKDLDTYEEE